ncbi:ribonuclease H-like domain-containing protein [Sediminicurvatus halobius]|uniref:YprB ribonuclease H-like domain-containing protein n=1 Tax=Sediminicurvatus halobius TaxID=2182432 RepID=A0A2U2MZW5_9GAMM|nr:ribonuclease H-like domain-containing protein [Spiribacter halobius]PWG62420.1 hypothetical protein DEM34_12415 [Spiribacter halobius]UEX79522.1 ribonuclease H-like domain-containing protein [Spiribacter halobius]
MSRLAARLDALRRESGAAAAPGAAPAGVAARLERLGAGRHGRVPAPRHLDEAALAAALGAERLAPGCLRRDRHVAVSPPAGPLPGLTAGAQRDALFLDTETSGLAGGTGTVAWMTGVARYEGNGLLIRQWFLTGFAGEAPMLAAVAEAIAGAAVVVTYNGGSFDLPLLRDRCRLVRGVPLPEPETHRDLLHDVRRLFARRWPDCRLASAEARLLGAPRTADLPGAEAPGVWLGLLRGEASVPVAGVLDHNAEDVRSLARMLPALAAAYAAPAESGADAAGAAGGWLRGGDPDRARFALEHSRAELDARALHRLASLYRREGRWADAVACWESLAGAGCPEATERLAKYHEHVARDPDRALALARTLPPGEAADHRRRRLQRRRETPRNLPLDLAPRPRE